MAVKTRGRKTARRKPRPFAERRRKPRLPDVERPAAEPDAATSRRAEMTREEEDDFANGRSSAGRAMRAEEDAWERGLLPEDRPFEEEDVPLRGRESARSKPSPEPEEPDGEMGEELAEASEEPEESA